MVAWVFPNDPILKRLPDMLDLTLMRLLLPRWLTALDLCGDYRLTDIQVDVLHYRAERTCMLRYRLDIENRATGQVSPLTVYGKIYGSGVSAEVFRVMEQLSKHSPRLITAIPLGYDADLNAVWQSHLGGDPLLLERSTPAQCLDAMQRIAHCVAAFHSSAVDNVKVATLKQILSQLAKTVTVIAGTYPQMGERVATLVRHLSARACEIDFGAGSATPIHRDLKLANFLLDDNGAALIDLDEVALGDPLIDIGSFVAAFSARALLLGWDEAAVDAVIERFLHHYAARVTWPLARERLDWYIAASFVYESIHRGVRQWDAEKLRNIPRWIAVAERYAYRATAAEPAR
jgi:Phosphotransferase enzyme family